MAPKTTEARMQDLTDELDRWSRLQIETTGRFLLGAAQAHLGQVVGNAKGRVGLDVVKRALTRLGDCVRLPGQHSGFTRPSCTVEQVTLARICEVAAQHVNAEGGVSRGGRTSRDVETLTPSQIDDARYAARVLATVLAGGEDRLEAVSGDMFGWDVAAGRNGCGDWRLCAVVAEASDRTAREKHQAANPGTPWAPQMGAAKRLKLTGSIRLLLDFAATKGLITRGPVQATASAFAPAWIPVIAAWGAEMGAGRSKSQSFKAGRGLRMLALYATRRGWMTPAATDWARLREAVLADHETGSLNASALDSARFAFNLLHDAGHLPERWPLQGDTRQSLVPNAAVTAAATTGDFSGWLMPDGRFAQALTDGVLGLRDWWRWATSPTPLLKAQGLPSRTFLNATDHQRLQVARRGDKAFRLGPSSCISRLSNFNLLAGFYASTYGLDWTQHGADELCNPAHLEAFWIARDRAAGRAVGSADSLVIAMAFSLATLASPYLEARASQEADRADAAGDKVRGAALRQRAQQLREWSTDLKEFAIRKSANARDKADHSTRKAQDTWLAWSADKVSGWHKLRSMRDLLVLDAEREFARCLGQQLPNGRWLRQAFIQTVPIEEQIALIERERDLPIAARTFRPSEAWTTRVRDAVVVTVLHRVPLREDNVVGMTFANWKAALSGRGQAQPFQGRISFEFSKEEMKSDRPFYPLFLDDDERDTPDGIASAQPALLQLYLMPGGAREDLLRLHATSTRWLLRGKHYGPGDVIPSPFIFPSIARKTGRTKGEELRLRLETGCRWDNDAFSNHWGEVVARYAAPLNLDMQRLKAIHGGAAPHACRHLFGTHHCNPNDHPDAIGLQNASRMLHHRDIAITQAKYIGTTEQQISVTKTVTRQQGGAEGRMAPLAMATPAPTSVQSIAAERINAMMDALIVRGVEGELDDAALAAALARLKSFQARMDAAAAT